MNSVRLFTLEGALQRHPAVERWFAAPPVELRSIARSWFQTMRSAGPDVVELLHDGHPTACVGNLALGYVNAFSEHVNVGFFFGSVLRDPSRLLEGSGRFMRHVKVRPDAFSHGAELRTLIAHAYVDIKSRLPPHEP
jgi:Domain of unknown function (DU1801)